MTQELCINSAPGQDDEVGQRADSVTTELADHARAEIEECGIRPEWPKCNLCRSRIFSSKPSGLVVVRNWERYWNDWPDGEGWNILVFLNFENSNYDVIFLRRVRNGHFGKNEKEEHKNNFICDSEQDENRD